MAGLGQTVTLSGDDGPGCGVATTYYTVNGGATQTYTSPFTVSARAPNLITYWSVDALGNTETTNSGYVNIDLTAPTVTDDAGTAWHDAAVTVHLTPADTGGSAWPAPSTACRARRPGDGDRQRLRRAGPGRSLRRRRLHLRVPGPGRGGQRQATHTCTVNIDTTAPTTTASGLQTDNHSGWRTPARP